MSRQEDDAEEAPNRTWQDSRRTVLRAGAIGAAGLAGCFHGGNGRTPSPDASPEETTTEAIRTPAESPDLQGGIGSKDGVGAAFVADNVELNAYSHHLQAEYAPEAETTFQIYQSTDAGGSSAVESLSDGDAYAVAFDHAERTVRGPVRVGFNPLTAKDNHGVPGMTLDGDGYIHTFFGCHGGYNSQAAEKGFRYARSAEPYSIDEWVHPPSGESGAGPLPAPAGTYPSPEYHPGEDAVYVLYRAGNGGRDQPYPNHTFATLARSGDNGKSWTDVNEGVIDQSGAPGDHWDAYVKDLGAWAGRLHITWTIAEGDQHDVARRGVYHAAYNPDTGQMETTSGEELGETITWPQPVERCQVRDTGEAVISNSGSAPGGGDSIRGFNQGYDPESDTAYIPASYGIDGETSETRLYSYEGVSDGSGEWTESAVILEQSPPSPHCYLRINEAGDPEINKPSADGQRGVWVPTEDGFKHRAYDLPDGVVFAKPVENGRDEFGWVGRKRIGSRDATSGRHLHTYAVGEGISGTATYPRPPQNLRVAEQSEGSVTIDWDEGLAGPASLERYDVYVDGERRMALTDLPNKDASYPQTFASLDLSSGDHLIWVTLTTRDGTESGASNVVDVSV